MRHDAEARAFFYVTVCHGMSPYVTVFLWSSEFVLVHRHFERTEPVVVVDLNNLLELQSKTASRPAFGYSDRRGLPASHRLSTFTGRIADDIQVFDQPQVSVIAITSRTARRGPRCPVVGERDHDGEMAVA
jgi:hypothetical protein